MAVIWAGDIPVLPIARPTNGSSGLAEIPRVSSICSPRACRREPPPVNSTTSTGAGSCLFASLTTRAIDDTRLPNNGPIAH